MSWLSPKRRRTTGNLKTLQNGQANSNNDNTNTDAPSTPGSPLQPQPRTPTSAERPPTAPSTPRPLSQPVISSSGVSQAQLDGGNLFYAYARRGDDLKSRYLLTFASAAIANEWWTLLQANFPSCTRPGPQLFSFQDVDLLPKAWKHGAFAHLKSKWMYISFSDTAGGNGVGGAAQGIIPVQDAQGNLLGGSAPASPSELMGKVRREAKEVKNEVTKLEEYFERMMEAVERNTEQVAILAKNQERAQGSQKGQDGQREGYFDGVSSELSSHLDRINELLARNSEHVESLAKRQHEHDEKLRSTLQEFSSTQKNDYLDISQLASHLDRIQSMMEQSTTERKDNANESAEPQARATPATQIDFSPLTDRLEKVQEAVEQNSALVKALLDEGNTADSRSGTPFWGKDTPVQQFQQTPQPVDLSPLTEHLQKIHTAIEQQSSHIQALVGFASGGAEDEGARPGSAAGHLAEKSLAPLGEHLEQIYNAIEEGNKHVKGMPKLDLQPLLDAIEEGNKYAKAVPQLDLKPLLDAVEEGNKHAEARPTMDLKPLLNAIEEGNQHVKGMPQLDLNPLLDAQNATREAVETAAKAGDTGLLAGKLDGLIEHVASMYSQSTQHDEHLQQIYNAIEQGNEHARGVPQLDLQPLLDAQNATRQAVETSSKAGDLGLLTGKLDGLIECLMSTHSQSQQHNEHLQELIQGQNGLHATVSVGIKSVDVGLWAEKLDGVNEHLEVLREWSEHNSEQNKELIEAQKEARTSAEAGENVSLGPLTGKFDTLSDHLEALISSSDSNAESLKHLLEAQQSAPAAPPPSEIDFTPLTERLNRIHDSLERQAQKRDVSPGSGDPKFIMSALTSHLSKIQAVTEANAHHVKTLREKQSATQDKMHIAVSQTADTVRSTASSLTQYQAQSSRLQAQSSQYQAQVDARLEATSGQVRELMAGQREMVDVMRELAKSITASSKGACDHVVIPPPRKVGRKIVGFVYDA